MLTQVVDGFLACDIGPAVVPDVPLTGALADADALADLAVRHGAEEAVRIVALISAVHHAEDQAQAIKQYCAIFASGLEKRGAGKQVVASRKCDLGAVLKAAAAFPDWVPDAAGLQGAAKQARKLGKSSAKAQTAQDRTREPLTANAAINAIAALLCKAYNIAEECHMGELAVKIDAIIKGL